MAPAGLRWADTGAARSATTVVALLALAGAIVLGVRQQVYISCVADQQRADQVRTSAIARATDNERRAQRLLIENIKPENSAGLRAAVLDAYGITDKARAANPPPEPGVC
jgi:hypothetical protein